MNLNNTAYKVIADVCGLKHVRDNIFTDIYGDKFYWDQYGFHSAFIFGSHEVAKKTRFLNQAIERYNRLETSEAPEMSRNARRNIRRVIQNPALSDKEKLADILKRVTITPATIPQS